VASDGMTSRVGTLTSDWERFMPWRTIEGEEIAPNGLPEMEVLFKGVFDRIRILDIIQNFVVFEDDGSSVVKKMAGYHQFHAVNKAVDCTIKACSPKGDRRVGVVWHTQGSGKSLTMAFYAGKVIRNAKMQNPTLVVLTDRNDLDDHDGRQVVRQVPPLTAGLGAVASGVEERSERIRPVGCVLARKIQTKLPEYAE